MLSDHEFLFLWWRYIAALSENCSRNRNGTRLTVVRVEGVNRFVRVYLRAPIGLDGSGDFPTLSHPRRNAMRNAKSVYVQG
jgi:hypothetical protein